MGLLRSLFESTDPENNRWGLICLHHLSRAPNPPESTAAALAEVLDWFLYSNDGRLRLLYASLFDRRVSASRALLTGSEEEDAPRILEMFQYANATIIHGLTLCPGDPALACALGQVLLELCVLKDKDETLESGDHPGAAPLDTLADLFVAGLARAPAHLLPLVEARVFAGLFKATDRRLGAAEASVRSALFLLAVERARADRGFLDELGGIGFLRGIVVASTASPEVLYAASAFLLEVAAKEHQQVFQAHLAKALQRAQEQNDASLIMNPYFQARSLLASTKI